LRLAQTSDEISGQGIRVIPAVLKNFPGETSAVTASNLAWRRSPKTSATGRGHEDLQPDQELQRRSDFKDLADGRLKLLPQIQEPVFVASATTKPVEAAPTIVAPPFMSPATQTHRRAEYPADEVTGLARAYFDGLVRCFRRRSSLE